MSQKIKSLLFKVRLTLGIFIFFLILSGLTAYPLLVEIRFLVSLLGINADSQGLWQWIYIIQQGLQEAYSKWPWIAYGTDWLAFGHVVIAIFFVGAVINPVQNIWIIKVGIIACLLVVPQALISGYIREIPFYWQLIDCSFGVLGILPLIYSLKLTKAMVSEKTDDI